MKILIFNQIIKSKEKFKLKIIKYNIKIKKQHYLFIKTKIKKNNCKIIQF